MQVLTTKIILVFYPHTKEPAPAMKPYIIVDTKTQQTVAHCATRVRAMNKADKLDLEYGAVRYVIRYVGN